MNISKQQDQTYSPIVTKSLGLRSLKSLQQNGKVATILNKQIQPMQVECNFESWEDTKIRKHLCPKMIVIIQKMLLLIKQTDQDGYKKVI